MNSKNNRKVEGSHFISMMQLDASGEQNDTG